MATIPAKRNLNSKSIKDKYNALKEVGDGNLKSKVPLKYRTPKKTLSAWLKNKEINFDAVKKWKNPKHTRVGGKAGFQQKCFLWSVERTFLFPVSWY